MQILSATSFYDGPSGPSRHEGPVRRPFRAVASSYCADSNGCNNSGAVARQEHILVFSAQHVEFRLHLLDLFYTFTGHNLDVCFHKTPMDEPRGVIQLLAKTSEFGWRNTFGNVLKMTARMVMVFLVALINLGLGFLLAVHLGRGPWSRHAKRSAANLALRNASQPKLVKSIEQIGTELQEMELRLQELLQRSSEDSQEQIDPKELLTTLRNMMAQVEAMAIDESQEHHEQATAGIRTMQQVLQTATSDLGQANEDERKGSFDPLPLLSNLQMTCREVSMVFNALTFAELPT